MDITKPGNEIYPESKQQLAEMEGEKVDYEAPASRQKDRTSWKERQDFWAFLFGLIFIGVIVGMIYAVGNARGWDADSGFSHNETSSQDRFWPEPDPEEPGVRGRYGVGATGRWYYWKLPPYQITVWTRFFPWMCYLLHQVLIWGSIYYAQCEKAKEPLGPKRYTSKMSSFNWFALGINALFHLLHFVNTHSTYDGIAQDVTISSSQGSVILLLVLVVIMEYKDRGVVFGWPTRHSNPRQCTVNALMPMGPIYLLKRYHGYAYSWAAVYTFWYHPMENTAGHAMGFIYTWLILLQGSLMYTDLHLNRYWKLFNEIWVIAHGGVVAYQTGGPEMMGTKLWPMFVFGFGLVFVVTQIFSLPFWRKAPTGVHVIPLAVYLGITVWCYSWIPDSDGNPWVRMQEIIRIPGVYYIFFVVGWALMLGFLAVEKRVKHDPEAVASTPGKRAGYLIGAMLIYAIMVGISIMIEYLDWKTDLTLIMITLVAVYTVGSSISFMLLKQAIPTRWPKSSDDGMDHYGNGVANGNGHSVHADDFELQTKTSLNGHANNGYNEHL